MAENGVDNWEVQSWWNRLSGEAKRLFKDVARPIAYWRLEANEKVALEKYYDQYVEKTVKTS